MLVALRESGRSGSGVLVNAAESEALVVLKRFLRL